MAEWSKAHAWKACVSFAAPRVQIPLSPLAFLAKLLHNMLRGGGMLCSKKAMMIKKLLFLTCCAVLVNDCAPLKRHLILEPPSTEEKPERTDIGAVRVVAVGDSFSETLPQDPKARLDWVVIWDKQMLKGSQSQGTVCLSDDKDSCLKVIKYEFKAMRVGEAKIEFLLKEKEDIIESFTSRVIVEQQ